MKRVRVRYRQGGRETWMEARYADILHRLGRVDYIDEPTSNQYLRRDIQAANTTDLSALRAEYQRVVGKRPFHGWDAKTLREKISETEGA